MAVSVTVDVQPQCRVGLTITWISARSLGSLLEPTSNVEDTTSQCGVSSIEVCVG